MSEVQLISEPHFFFLTGKVPPVVITVTPYITAVYNSQHEITAPQRQSRFSIWLTIGVLFGCLLVMAVIPTAVCVLRRNYTKLR